MRDDVVPSGPDELFRIYYGYVRKIVGNTPTIQSQDVEDVSMEIMTRLIERDVLGMFDPAKTFSYDGKEIPARFRTFLTAQVTLYTRGQRDKLGRQHRREMFVIDKPPAEGEGLSWADMFGRDDDLSELDASEWISQARSFLATVPKRSDRDNCDLVRLFDDLISQVASTGTVRAAETAERFGVSAAVTGRWVRWLRENLRQQASLSRRVQVGGETYTLFHVRQAVDILQSVRGAPHVKGPLVRARNPLGQMNYHKLSRYERATYPECEVPSGKGKGHYGPHVLTAVVHSLERTLAVAG